MKICPLCKSEVQERTLAEFSGEEGALKMTLRGMPVLECQANHRHFIDPDFPAWLMTHLVQEDEAALPAGEARGFLVKRYDCGTCGKPLEPKPDHRHAFHVDLRFRDTQPFAAEISMPVFRCTACGKEQLHSLPEVRKLTPEALVNAFKLGGIRPPA